MGDELEQMTWGNNTSMYDRESSMLASGVERRLDPDMQAIFTHFHCLVSSTALEKEVLEAGSLRRFLNAADEANVIRLLLNFVKFSSRSLERHSDLMPKVRSCVAWC